MQILTNATEINVKSELFNYHFLITEYILYYRY